MRTILFMLMLLPFTGFAQEKETSIPFQLPDSVKAAAFITTVNIKAAKTGKEAFAGIRTGSISLSIEADKKDREISFSFPFSATVLASGVGVEIEKDEMEWDYNWKLNTDYKLMLAAASDSAGNFSIYSGYIWLPEMNQWKLVGTCRLNGTRDMIKSPAAYYSAGKKNSAEVAFSSSWVQRTNGTWRSLGEEDLSKVPVVNLLNHSDSIAQDLLDRQIIRNSSAAARWDSSEGVYYSILDPGNGRSIAVTDTVTVKYQLRIFGATEIIDQATEKPATFPLHRLIKGWQIAIPLVKTGGKLKIVIPSGQAYSIRTRSPKIPPNSILEFEIEVLDAKPAIRR